MRSALSLKDDLLNCPEVDVTMFLLARESGEAGGGQQEAESWSSRRAEVAEP